MIGEAKKHKIEKNFCVFFFTGGSLCIVDLTLTGWKPENDIETFIVLIRNLLMEGYTIFFVNYFFKIKFFSKGGALINLDNLNDYTVKNFIIFVLSF